MNLHTCTSGKSHEIFHELQHVGTKIGGTTRTPNNEGIQPTYLGLANLDAAS
jgi:hypothetical protein